MLAEALERLDKFLWGPGTLALLLGTGAFFLLRTGFLPWRNLGWALKAALGRTAHQSQGGGISPFSALMTALASTIGTGNIVGVATALTGGGPGALIWMELSALLGLPVKCAECLLAVKYQQTDRQGRPYGGPMYVMREALGRPGAVLGILYALFAVCAALDMGGMTQSNSIAQALHTAFGLSPRTVGLVTAALAAAVILGGAGSITRVSAGLVPLMAVCYLLCGLAVIIGNWRNLPAALEAILLGAFSPRSVAGGAAGTLTAAVLHTARWGVARGVFSHESGMGAAAISAASAGGSPARQGYINMTGVFLDTMVLCTVTGLAICCSGALGTLDGNGMPVDGAALTIRAFSTVLGPLGAGAVAVFVALFAFSTILGWAYQGELAFACLSGGRLLPLFRLSLVLTVLLGAEAKLEAVFRLSDICCVLMCLPNLLCLLVLSGDVAKELRTFERVTRQHSGGAYRR